jgi:lysophospholipase L1-like esterase
MDGMAAPRCVLFLGDSLVAGVGDGDGGGWVARIVAGCHAQGIPVTAYNLGVRGETSLQVAARWHAEARPRMRAGADHRLIVSFGANDTTREHGVVRTDPEDSTRALSGILDQARSLGFAPFVIGPAALDDDDQNDRIADLSARFARVCEQHATPFVSLLEPLLASPVWMSEVAAGDGAHPGAAGYEALTRVLLDGGLLGWLSGPVSVGPTAVASVEGS